MSSESNKALIREFFDQVWNKGNEAAIARFIAEDAAGNDPDFGIGRTGFTQQWRKWQDAFNDLHFEIEEMIAEGDTVVARWTLTGRQIGPFLGAAPTGRAIRVAGMSLDHLRDGQLVSGFDGWDNLGLRQQLGLLPKNLPETSPKLNPAGRRPAKRRDAFDVIEIVDPLQHDALDAGGLQRPNLLRNFLGGTDNTAGGP
jgi:steroid delta-isomerase-like uncharacterized protein